MAQLMYGKRRPFLIFRNDSDFYECLGFVCNMARHGIEIVWEYNQQSGAWANEGRIHFKKINGSIYTNIPNTIRNRLTAGNGNVAARLNCNDYILALHNNYGFTTRVQPNGITPHKLFASQNPLQYVPTNFYNDFNRGYNM